MYLASAIWRAAQGFQQLIFPMHVVKSFPTFGMRLYVPSMAKKHCASEKQALMFPQSKSMRIEFWVV